MCAYSDDITTSAELLQHALWQLHANSCIINCISIGCIFLAVCLVCALLERYKLFLIQYGYNISSEKTTFGTEPAVSLQIFFGTLSNEDVDCR